MAINGPVVCFDYHGETATEPHPVIIPLGRFKHPTTGNTLIQGLKLNDLTPAQEQDLQSALPNLMQAQPEARYWMGKKLIPDLIREVYRTYLRCNMRNLKH